MKRRTILRPTLSINNNNTTSTYHTTSPSIRCKYLTKLGFDVSKNNNNDDDINNSCHDWNLQNTFYRNNNHHRTRSQQVVPPRNDTNNATPPTVISFKKKKNIPSSSTLAVGTINDESSHTSSTYLLDDDHYDDHYDYGDDKHYDNDAQYDEIPTTATSHQSFKDDQNYEAHDSPRCISMIAPTSTQEEEIESLSSINIGCSAYKSTAKTKKSSTISQDVLSQQEHQEQQQPRRSVSFHETVTVLTIPNKDSYSNQVRKYLWTEPHDMLQNIERNVIEFASENWDWRQVADDIEFYICPVTGEKIHPCHGRMNSHSHYQERCFSVRSYSNSYSTTAVAAVAAVPPPPASSSENVSSYRPISKHPFFQKSKEAAMEWENCGRYMYSNQ